MNKEDYTLAPQIAPDAMVKAREELAAQGWTRIDNVLAGKSAISLRRDMESLPWALMMRVKRQLHEIDADLLARLGEEGLREFAFAGSEEEAGFRQIHDAVTIPSAADKCTARGFAIDRLALAWSMPEALDGWQEMLGDRPVARLVAMASRYRPGHFLSDHDDGEDPRRIVAFVLSLNEGWQEDWGGQLVLQDDNGNAQSLVPRFNVLNVFTVPRVHYVAQVAEHAQQGRYSVTGWMLSSD
tara:strand:+ start:1203 stop:1925 length:723 start_codon:yes stop_codon:yes gene_type:complete